jgi:flavin reductase (DIM6/NTAB) family NADH-FMN oxidoreductase RutF
LVIMDADQKKTALRMIPYGLYVLTAQDKSGARTAATVNWVTQASFEPPLVVVGVKADSHAKTVIGASGTFALNFLGKGQEGIAMRSLNRSRAMGSRSVGSPIASAQPARPF